MVEQNASPGEAAEVQAKSGWMRGVDKVADGCLSVSMYVLYPAILLVICIDVIGRNFFHTPLSWAIEGSGLFLIGAIFLAVPRVELDRGHILLDILYASYPDTMKWLCDTLTRAFAFLWMVGATIRSAMEIPTAYLLNESGADFRYPFWPMRVIMTIGFLVLALALLSNVVDSYRHYRQGGRKK
ncbi:MAG: TRAP transporter small permease [Desulfovibrionaceae bacterium]|nr:TRAP transporter small permease [Desulfovibrionaceae bacterium]